MSGDLVGASVTITGDCESGLSVDFSGDLSAVTTSCLSGTYSTTINFTSVVSQDW